MSIINLYPLRVLHGRLHEWRINALPLYLERLRNPKAVYLVYTPEHGNLGDHAIAQSEKELLNELKIPFIEFSGRKLVQLRKRSVLNIMNGRTILIHGGGFLGTIWPESEALTQKIIINNPKSKILVLPNTIYYENTPEAQRALFDSKAVYNSNPQLKMFAREKISYETMKTIYRDVALVPDMVLRMNKCQKGINRKGCILCLRSDRERTRSEEEDRILRKQIKRIFGNHISERDMVKEKPIRIQERDEALEEQYDAFRHAELVVTDRLHGMIFAAITGTPCIVINSKSPKVRGCYEWIKDLPYIKFCDNVSDLSTTYQTIEKKEYYYNNDKLLPLYDVLKKAILSAAGRI